MAGSPRHVRTLRSVNRVLPLRGILNPSALQFDTISCPLFVAPIGNTVTEHVVRTNRRFNAPSTELLFHLLLIYGHVRFPAVHQAHVVGSDSFNRPHDVSQLRERLESLSTAQFSPSIFIGQYMRLIYFILQEGLICLLYFQENDCERNNRQFYFPVFLSIGLIVQYPFERMASFKRMCQQQWRLDE